MIRRILHWFRCEWGSFEKEKHIYFILAGYSEGKRMVRTCKICGRQEFK